MKLQLIVYISLVVWPFCSWAPKFAHDITGMPCSICVWFNLLVKWNYHKTVQGLFVPFACVGSGDPVRVLHLYTTNTLDTIEAFIAETYVQLAATEAMCYSTG